MALIFFGCNQDKSGYSSGDNSKSVSIRDYTIPVDKILDGGSMVKILIYDEYDDKNEWSGQPKLKNISKAYLSGPDTILISSNYMYSQISEEYFYEGGFSDIYASDGTIIPIYSGSNYISNGAKFPAIFKDEFSTDIAYQDSLSGQLVDTVRFSFKLVQNDCFEGKQQKMLRLRIEPLDNKEGWQHNQYLAKGYGTVCGDGFFLKENSENEPVRWSWKSRLDEVYTVSHKEVLDHFEDIVNQVSIIRNWYVRYIWNEAINDIKWYVQSGTNSIGQELDIDFCIRLFNKEIDRSLSKHYRYINNIATEEFLDLKYYWNKMHAKIAEIQEYVNSEEVIKRSKDPNFLSKTSMLKQYFQAFDQEIDRLRDLLEEKQAK